MKKIFILCLFLGGLLHLYAQDADVEYTDGLAEVRNKAGASHETYIGDRVKVEETVITGYDGYVELSQEGSVISIKGNTVFKLMEKEAASKKHSVFACILGSIYLKVQQVTGTGPEVVSGSMAAGVRGTEFEVFSGFDGSSLIKVDKGLVLVESEGVEVELAPDEAVEVKPGQPPGEKFKVRDPIDYSEWNEGLFNSFIKDPISAINRIESRMVDFINKIEELYVVYKENMAWIENEKAKLDEIEKNEGVEERKKYYMEKIAPLGTETSYIYVNIRFYSLSILSLRRFVIGRMYLYMKTMYITNPKDEIYEKFINKYNSILGLFEENVLNFLVDDDI